MGGKTKKRLDRNAWKRFGHKERTSEKHLTAKLYNLDQMGSRDTRRHYLSWLDGVRKLRVAKKKHMVR